MDVKKVQVSYLLDLTHDEFVLLFRAVGQACGAKGVKVREDEMPQLQKLNVKIADIRAKTIAQMHDQAQAALKRAQGLETSEEVL